MTYLPAEAGGLSRPVVQDLLKANHGTLGGGGLSVIIQGMLNMPDELETDARESPLLFQPLLRLAHGLQLDQPVGQVV